MLKITKKIEDKNVIFELEGRLDTNTSPQLEIDLKKSIDGVTSLIFDLEKLDYISSAGLRVLLSAQKIMNVQGTMKLIHVKQEVKEVFEVTGFTDILTIE